MAVDYTYHDEETMQKVWAGMKRAGVPDKQAEDAIGCIMNQGILFRESLGRMGPIVGNTPEMPVRSVYDMTFCLVENCAHARYRHEDKSGQDGHEGDGECYLGGCPCMAGIYPSTARVREVKPDPITDGHPYADEVSFSEFIRLLKAAHGDAWAVLVDGEFRLLLRTPERKYKSALPLRQVDFTMFVFTVMRIMEERGKPWVSVK